MSAPPPTSRLLRAVVAERDELDRHHARMTEEADELRRALARIERGLVEIDERRALLDQLLPPAAARPGGEPATPAPSPPASAPGGRRGGGGGRRGEEPARARDQVTARAATQGCV